MYTKKIVILIISTIILGGALIVYIKPYHTNKPQARTEILADTNQKNTQNIPPKAQPIPDNRPTTPPQTTNHTISTPTNDTSASSEISKDITAYTVPVFTTSTVLQAMKVFQDTDSDFSFSGRDFPGLGFFVDSIGGKKSAKGFYWTLFINNNLSETGVSSTNVMPGDTILWRYQKGI